MTAPVTKGNRKETHYVALMDLPIVGRHKQKKLKSVISLDLSSSFQKMEESLFQI